LGTIRLSISISAILIVISITSSHVANASISPLEREHITKLIFYRETLDKWTDEETTGIGFIHKSVTSHFDIENGMIQDYRQTGGYTEGSFLKHGQFYEQPNTQYNPISSEQNRILEEAIRLYDRALEIDPDDPIVHYNKGVALLGLDRNDQAAEELTKSLETAGDDDDCFLSNILYNLSTVLFKLERYDESIENLDKILRVIPNSTDALNTKGLVLYNQGNYNASIEMFDKALKIDLNYADVWNNKGNALLQLGKSEEAIKHYERASELNKSQKSMNGGGNSVCDELGDLKNIEPLASPILYYSHNGESGHFSSPIFVDYLNNDLLINVSLEKEESVKQIIYLTNQGIALAKAQKYPEALKLYDAVLIIDANYAPALYSKAEALEKLGNFKDALDNYKKAQDSDPEYKGESIGVTETRPTTDTKEYGVLAIFSKNIKTMITAPTDEE
jgi:tetratricopeptide (TPR) repeat protein